MGIMDNLFDKLNEQQIEAVTATEGYVRIIAGAGSGKTKTLTHRYAYLVKAAGIHPGNVLCVTFTNKAAGEMKRRVRSLVGDGYDTSLITTYHGFCVRVLREDIGRLFYPQNFQILDESDQKNILSEIYAELEIKLDRASFEKILESIHYIKAHKDYVDDLISGSLEPAPNETLEQTIIRMYMKKQRKTFGLDFDDLISFAFAVFDKFPNVLEKWQERLHYIQVDEFQDSSFRELKLIQKLSAVHHNLFVVGDPDQNIYEWRGADMSILVDFDKTFPGTNTVMLNQNYRSTGKILKAANTIIAYNKHRIPKDLFTAGGPGEDVIHLHAKSEDEEGKWISKEIKQLVKSQKYSYRNIAILYRSGFLSRFIEQALNSAGIPYELYGSLRFYDRMEIRDILAYLKLIVYNDNQAFERIINIPKRMFGKQKMMLLKELALQDGLSYYETLVKHLDIPAFARSGAESFVRVIEEARSTYKNLPVSDVIQNILTSSGYEQYIRENGSMERLDNLSEFKRTAHEQERDYGEFFSLEEFLQQIALQTEKTDGEAETDKVKLMTIHASKGLEFPVCFVCGFTDGIFPSGRTLEERKDAGLEEERRLCFVALTRAMKRLYITESEGNTTDGQASRKKQPSRFVFEIGEENYLRIGTIPKELSEKAEAYKKKDGNGTENGVRTVGSVVEHPVFGRGVITDIDTQRNVYSILFEKTNTVKPVDIDYNFDIWKNINELKQNAIDAARKQPAEPEEIKPDTDGTSSPPVSDFIQGLIDSLNNSSDKPELKGNLENSETEEKPDIRIDSEEQAKSENKPYDYDIDNSQLQIPYIQPNLDNISNDEKNSDISEIDIEEIDDVPSTSEEPKAADGLTDISQYPEEMQIEDIQISSKELPEKYRYEDWANQPVDYGEENLWKRSDVPHDGWSCIDIIDLGEPNGICRMCGHQIIRYVHVMFHPNYPKRIGAGCICAGRMEGNPEAARERENAFKNRQSRLETFLNHPLKRSRNGNEYFKYHNEIITLFRDKFREGYYRTAFRNSFSASYPTKEEALKEAFDKIDPPIKPIK